MVRYWTTKKMGLATTRAGLDVKGDVGTPDDIHIVITGGPGKHSAFIPTFGTSKSVTRKIEAPGR
jgi:hypothetical protein